LRSQKGHDVVSYFGRSFGFLIVAGLLWRPLDRPNPARSVGALLTYACGLALAAGLLAT
jgi:hypothetical protein